MNEHKKNSLGKLLLQVFQGALIGLGAVLPGISGGVLSVIFGIYKPIMELLANPFGKFKSHVPMLIPYVLGAVIGFLGIANLLSYVLEKYPNPSVCLFIGLITGMLPSLWREAGEQGRTKGSYISLLVGMVVIFALLIGLQNSSVEITPNFMWFVFCGFCLALSLIAPGMSFSTLLMPLGLYTPFVDGIGHFSMSVLIPAGIGVLATVICLSKAINVLFDKYYSLAFHVIVGIVIAATIMIIPFESFTISVRAGATNLLCIGIGIIAALLLDQFNSKVSVE